MKLLFVVIPFLALLPVGAADGKDAVQTTRHGGQAEGMLAEREVDELAKQPRVKGRFAYMRTRHLNQGYNMCAPTSAAMALEFYLRKPVDPYAIKENSTGATERGTGTPWDYLMHGIRAVSGHEWDFRSWANDEAGFNAGMPVLLTELDAGRIALIDLGPHTVVLAGYDATRRVVFVQNPACRYPGVQAVSYYNLRQRWHSPWHLSTTKGVEARPVLLTADSWRKTKKAVSAGRSIVEMKSNATPNQAMPPWDGISSSKSMGCKRRQATARDRRLCVADSPRM